MEILVLPITFEEILPVWTHELWPGRKDAIEPVSIIASDGSLSLEAPRLTAVFYKASNSQNETVGVISAIRTAEKEVRSRGIWVNPALRGKGIGARLLGAIETHAREQGCEKIWSMPRAQSIGFYLKQGFAVTGTLNRYEFGPHYLVEKHLRTPEKLPSY